MAVKIRSCWSATKRLYNIGGKKTALPQCVLSVGRNSTRRRTAGEVWNACVVPGSPSILDHIVFRAHAKVSADDEKASGVNGKIRVPGYDRICAVAGGPDDDIGIELLARR